MLADRHYMRREPERFQWNVIPALIFVTATCYVFQIIAEHDRIFAVNDDLGLSTTGLRHGYLWQLITFQFLHSGIVHLVLNMAGLYYFGRWAEDRFQGWGFIKLYLVCGIAGGLVQMAFGAVFPERFGGVVLGASAGTSGLLGAALRMRWYDRFQILVAPTQSGFSGKNIFWMCITFSVVGMLMPMTKLQIAHAAHMGGMAMGVVCVNWVTNHGGWLSWPWLSRQVKKRSSKQAAVRPIWNTPESGEVEESASGDFISKEVDPILDKIHAKGFGSLTAREREILEKARAKMAKR